MTPHHLAVGQPKGELSQNNTYETAVRRDTFHDGISFQRESGAEVEVSRSEHSASCYRPGNEDES